LNKYGRKEEIKIFLCHLVINSDYSAKIGLQVQNNTKNNVVYGETRKSIPRELLETPKAKYFQGFMMWGTTGLAWTYT
jgi:thermostable 8-oxoguanine DNA glycosylase